MSENLPEVQRLDNGVVVRYVNDEEIKRQVRSLYGSGVDAVRDDDEFREAVFESASMITTAYGVELSAHQRYIMAVVLKSEGLSKHDVRRAARYILSSGTYADKARYKVPLTAHDIITAATISNPSWRERR